MQHSAAVPFRSFVACPRISRARLRVSLLPNRAMLCTWAALEIGNTPVTVFRRLGQFSLYCSLVKLGPLNS